MTKSKLLVWIAAVVVTASVAQAQQLRKSNGSQAATKPGQSFKECRNCPDMVIIPAGAFMMGSPADEPDRRESERQHKVNIARLFAIGRTEVTWDQWEACAIAGATASQSILHYARENRTVSQTRL
jgi:formylglycine-generating enzyme required for sulfatase activity